MKYIKDISLIVVSVLLAFILNEWRTEYREQRDTNATLDNIHTEIERNKVIADTLYAYHLKSHNRLRDSLQSDFFIKKISKGVVPDFYSFFPKGIIQDHISTIAYEIATHKNLITKTSIDQAMDIQRVYDQQKTIFNTISNLLEIIEHPDFYERKNLEVRCRLLSAQMNELTGQERMLLRFYNNYLKQY